MSTANTKGAYTPVPRRLQVFVDIPYSPIPFMLNMQSLKRKPSHPGLSLSPAKKFKLITNSVKDNHSSTKPSKADLKRSSDHHIDASSEFPNGYLYCHQCNRKRDADLVLQCTSAKPNTHKTCKGKYCKPCMVNRYGQDFESIKAKVTGKTGTKADDKFKCPKCCGICNCRNCRRAQGLEPTGNLLFAARNAGKLAAQLLVDNSAGVGVLPGKGQQIIRDKKPTIRQSKVAEAGSDTTSKPTASGVSKPKRQRTTKLNIPQDLRWFKVPVPAEMSLDDLETRIFIREFMMRFSTIMDKDSTAHLDELEEIVGDGTLEWTGDVDGQNFDSDDGGGSSDTQPLISWVSEGCVKSIFMGLLGLLANSSNSDLTKRTVTAAFKAVRNSSANLTKIWIALASMRRELGNSLYIPNPLPPPASMPVYYTRRGAVLDPHAEGTQVGHSAQLLPITKSLIEELLVNSKAIKTDIDGSSAEGKQLSKQVKEAIQAENDRWRLEKTKAIGKLQSMEARLAHKRNLEDLEGAQRILSHASTPRFGPLGTDDEGRIYYALSPGLVERDAALRLIDGQVMQRPKRGRKAGGGALSLDDKERRSLTNFSWFVAVWGQKPADAIVVRNEDEDEDEDEDDVSYDKEQWWGFWEPDQIKALALWIANRNGLKGIDNFATGSVAAPTVNAGSIGEASETSSAAGADESPLTDLEDQDEDGDDTKHPLPSKKSLNTLINALNDYADLLSWRVNRGERAREGKH